AAGRYGHKGEGWHWALAAEVGVALGTTLLALATVVLAYGVRRPSLELHAEDVRVHSRIERSVPFGDQIPFLRLLVTNAPRKRSAKGTRVLLDGYSDRDAPS